MNYTIPDHVGREAVLLLNEEHGDITWSWPSSRHSPAVITVAKLLMNPPAPMTDPDEEAAKRVLSAGQSNVSRLYEPNAERLTAATEQMRKEREAWEAGR